MVHSNRIELNGKELINIQGILCCAGMGGWVSAIEKRYSNICDIGCVLLFQGCAHHDHNHRQYKLNESVSRSSRVDTHRHEAHNNYYYYMDL